MNKTLLASALVLSAFIAPVSYAATADGALGATSTGNVDVDLEVLDSVQISDLDAIDFGTYGGTDTGARNLGDDYCVYVNGGDSYTITPTSTNAAFELAGGSFGDTIPYVVKLNGAATGAAAAASVAYSDPSASFTGSSSLTCGGTNNASLDVSIAEQDIRDATTDTYSDTLILVVSPI